MIELKNVSKIYKMGKIEVKALQDVSLKIEKGEFVAIIGPSGSGKSTLLHILSFLDRPSSGSYILKEKDITNITDEEAAVLRNSLVGFVFQQFHLLPRLTAQENARLPLIYAGKRHLKNKALEKIKEVGLEKRADHKPNELSGGEQQRVAIARSLVNEPMVIMADEPTGNLDTKSEQEIISILENLNRTGKTIIMVTHEKEIAEKAKRVISMRDGRIISDKKQETGKNIFPAGSSGQNNKNNNIPSKVHSGVEEAELTDHLRQAVFSILSNKMRSILSMLGILIGVAAVIAMLALGQGAKESIAKSLESLGSNLLVLRPGSHRMHGVALEAGSVTRFTMQDVDAISRLPEIKSVSPSVSGRAQVVYGNKNWNTQVQGKGENYAVMRAAVPTIGRFFTEDELRMRQKVAVLGTTVSKELFGNANPVGSIIKVNRVNFQIIGLLPEKGANAFRDQDDLIVIPITTAMYRLLGKEYVDSIDIEAKDQKLMEEAQEKIKALMIKRHRIPDEKIDDSFEIRNMSEIQETLSSTTQTMTWLLGSIAAISLLVGGIGIMNIMLVSVTERTREIGLRKAIGARKIDIMIQFLIESVVLTFAGGIAGILFGWLIAWLLATFAGWATKISTFSVILATLFSVGVGVGFGLLPAQKAAKLNPIEALRYE